MAEIDIIIDSMTDCLIHRHRGRAVFDQQILWGGKPMIVKERPPIIGPTEDERFDETSLDGRLTEPNDGVLYHVREIAFKMKQLGRQLTDKELEEFIIRQ